MRCKGAGHATGEVDTPERQLDQCKVAADRAQDPRKQPRRIDGTRVAAIHAGRHNILGGQFFGIISLLSKEGIDPL